LDGGGAACQLELGYCRPPSLATLLTFSGMYNRSELCVTCEGVMGHKHDILCSLTIVPCYFLPLRVYTIKLLWFIQVYVMVHSGYVMVHSGFCHLPTRRQWSSDVGDRVRPGAACGFAAACPCVATGCKCTSCYVFILVRCPLCSARPRVRPGHVAQQCCCGVLIAGSALLVWKPLPCLASQQVLYPSSHVAI